MENIQCFSDEVCKEIKYYVYRLVDPRNGETFYVGKGKDNRVFAHVKCALDKFDDGKKYFSKEENNSNLKLQRIRDIEQAGLKVIHIIHRWNIENDKMAYQIESAVMDCYPGLTNIQKGHYHENGMINASTLQKNFSKQIYEEPDGIDYVLIKTSEGRVSYCLENYPCNSLEEALYEATRSAWNLGLNSAKKYKYVLSVINGIVKEVYVADQWMQSECKGRIEFEGHVAEESIRNYFINKRIPDKYRKKGNARAAMYKQ